jgi:uncharacterized protein (TIGR01244 family)
MEIKNIDQRFSTAGQLSEADLETIASQGYQLVINFRPDGEGDDTQPANAALAAKAQALGLAYAYVPVVPNQIQPTHVEQVSKLLNEHKGPVLGFCRTGNRANNVYQQALHAGGLPKSDALTKPDCCCQPQQDEDKNLSSRLLGWLKR